jgi:hypothetical protein
MKITIDFNNKEDLSRKASEALSSLVNISFYSKAISIIDKSELTDWDIKFLYSISEDWARGRKYPNDWSLKQCEMLFQIYQKKIKKKKY